MILPELPLRHVTLPCAVISDRQNPAVGTQRDGMPLSGGDGADVGPRLHLALAVLDVPGGHYRPVLFHGNGVVGADGDGGEVRPVQDTGGDEAIGLEQSAVLPQAQAVHVPGSDGGDVLPMLHGAGAEHALPGGEDRSIHFDRLAEGQGASMALPIYALYMQKVYKDKTLGYSEDETFEIPEKYANPCSEGGEEDSPTTPPDTGGIDKMFE